MDLEKLKAEAARRAVRYVASGMRIGLGTGSTARYAILEIARRIKTGTLENITGAASAAGEKRRSAI